MATNRSKRSRWVRGAAFAGIVTVLPAASAATLSPMASPSPTPSAIILHEVELVPGNGCPSNMARVGASCVDKYEASLVAVDEDGKESPFSPYATPEGHKVRAVSRAGVVPQAHISMLDAKRACSASGKRLCRAQEWKTACKGPDSTRYPYGDTRVPGACVDTNRTAPMTVLHQGEHSARTMNDPLANQQENTLEPTGSAPECTNGYGVHDMVGNVHEWTDDGSFRGGYYLDTTQNGEGCEYRTTAHAIDYYDYSTGFRCCADADSLDEGEGG
jgi:sulfatase-modifying factor enzyme 1